MEKAIWPTLPKSIVGVLKAENREVSKEPRSYGFQPRSKNLVFVKVPLSNQ